MLRQLHLLDHVLIALHCCWAVCKNSQPIHAASDHLSIPPSGKLTNQELIQEDHLMYQGPHVDIQDLKLGELQLSPQVLCLLVWCMECEGAPVDVDEDAKSEVNVLAKQAQHILLKRPEGFGAKSSSFWACEHHVSPALTEASHETFQSTFWSVGPEVLPHNKCPGMLHDFNACRSCIHVVVALVQHWTEFCEQDMELLGDDPQVELICVSSPPITNAQFTANGPKVPDCIACPCGCSIAIIGGNQEGASHEIKHMVPYGNPQCLKLNILEMTQGIIVQERVKHPIQMLIVWMQLRPHLPGLSIHLI